MNVLLTGAGGQLGGDLLDALVAAGHQVVATDLAPRADGRRRLEATDWQSLSLVDVLEGSLAELCRGRRA